MKRRRKGGGDDLTYKLSRNSLKNELIFLWKREKCQRGAQKIRALVHLRT